MQRMGVGQGQGKCLKLCFDVFSFNLAQRIDVEQDRGKHFCLEAFSKSISQSA